MAKNVSYPGGLIMSLARALHFVARALPILSGLTTGLLSGGINKSISGNGAGEILYTNMINAIEYRNAKIMVSI